MGDVIQFPRNGSLNRFPAADGPVKMSRAMRTNLIDSLPKAVDHSLADFVSGLVRHFGTNLLDQLLVFFCILKVEMKHASVRPFAVAELEKRLADKLKERRLGTPNKEDIAECLASLAHEEVKVWGQRKGAAADLVAVHDLFEAKLYGSPERRELLLSAATLILGAIRLEREFGVAAARDRSKKRGQS